MYQCPHPLKDYGVGICACVGVREGQGGATLLEEQARQSLFWLVIVKVPCTLHD